MHKYFGKFDFTEIFQNILMENEVQSKTQKREMKSFETSNKAKKIMLQRGTLELTTIKKDEKKAKKDDGAGKMIWLPVELSFDVRKWC